MVKKFRGKVKVSDVQHEFDVLVNKINYLDARINDVSQDKENIDWRYGSSSLAPSNFTLTVGGLKKALEGFDGAVYGARAFKTDSTHFKMSTGLLISKYGGFKLPDSVLSIPTSNRILYYNVFTSQYQWSDTGSGTVIIDNPFQAPTDIQKVSDIRLTDMNGDTIPTNVYCNKDGENNETVVAQEFTNYDPETEMPNEIPVCKFTNIPSIQESFKIDTKNYFKIPLNGVDSNTKSISFNYGGKISDPDDQGGYTDASALAKGNFIFGILERDATTFTPVYRVGISGIDTPRLTAEIISNTPTYSPMSYPNQDKYIANFSLLSTATSTQHEQQDGSFVNMSNMIQTSLLWSGYDCDISYKEENINDTTYPTLEFHFVVRTINEQYPIDFENRIKISNYYMSDFEYLSHSELNTIVLNARDLLPKINCVLVDNSDENTEDILSVEQSDYTYSKNRVIRPIDYYPECMTQNGQFHYGEPEQVTDGVYKICEIAPQRDSLYLNDISGTQVEDVYGKFEIGVQNRIIAPLVSYNHWDDTSEAVNNSNKPLFVCGIDDNSEGADLDWHEYSILYFQGREISRNRQPDSRDMQFWVPMNYLYLPKGASNPFSYNRSRANATKVFNVIIKKDIKG